MVHALRSAAGLLGAVGLVAGCAATSGPDRQLYEASGAIERAVQAGVSLPISADLSLARQKFALAHRLSEAQDYRPAVWLAEQAKVDAELAEMKAMSARSRLAAAAAASEFRMRLAAGAAR
jgi:hypothetical protein